MSLSTTDALKAFREAEKSIKFSPAAHRYSVDGGPMPSVSAVIKSLAAPALENWKIKQQVEGTAKAAFANPPRENEPIEGYIARMKALAAEGMEHEKVAKEAADEGKDVHLVLEWRMRTELGEVLPRPKVSEAAAFREAGWMDWAKSVGLKPLAVEGRLANRRMRYCGTFDLLAIINGQVSLLDFKRASAVYESHILQSVGYKMCLEELGFARMPGYVLLMPPGETPRLAECEDTEETRAAFLACLSLYNWTKALAKARRG